MPKTYPSSQARLNTSVSLRYRILNLPNLVAIAVALSLVYFLVARFEFDLSSAWDVLRRNNLMWYGLAFASYYLIFPLRGLRWRILLENAGCLKGSGSQQVPVVRLAELSFLGGFVDTVTIFRMGFFYRCSHVSRQANSSFALVAGSLFSERVIDTILTFALMLITALALLSTPAAFIVGPALLGAAVTCLVLGGAMLAMAIAGLNPGRILPSKLRAGYDNFRQGTLESFRRWPWLVVLSIAIWACESARLVMIVHALGLSVDLPLLLFVALVASLITSFPITPGGLGLVEASMTGLLATALTWEQAVAVALLDRSVNYLSVVLLGGAWFMVRSFKGWDAPADTEPVPASLSDPSQTKTPRPM